MVRVRIAKSPKSPSQSRRRKTAKTSDKAEQPRRGPRGLSERQWFISLLVASGLLLLITFRGCILPSGVGPKSKPNPTPTPTGQATPTPVSAAEYTVVSGDTLSGIAQKNGVTLEALLQANGLTTASRLQVGQKLKIPK